ncbi:hypothetical protein [Desulforhopalus singaporensis]|uniref:Cell division protein FtsL n=1 Tax=Desulforhopalus singaporensis TaxID=91360 RepID=A0A1H0UL56_9BACT|nr:hypothetical protein [Desulforhopalus singaporensis]SDP66606.1 hypothetical protein SAMN05660330_03601 [Desulforhopalus singaporensis]
MIYSNTTQIQIRSASKVDFLSKHRRRSMVVPGSMAMWRRVGKIVLMILPVVLLFNIVISSTLSSMDRSMSRMEAKVQQLENRNIDLLAKRARLWTPGNIEKLAGERLELYSATKDQVGKFNRRLATFSYL